MEDLEEVKVQHCLQKNVQRVKERDLRRLQLQFNMIRIIVEISWNRVIDFVTALLLFRRRKETCTRSNENKVVQIVTETVPSFVRRMQITFFWIYGQNDAIKKSGN